MPESNKQKIRKQKKKKGKERREESEAKRTAIFSVPGWNLLAEIIDIYKFLVTFPDLRTI